MQVVAASGERDEALIEAGASIAGESSVTSGTRGESSGGKPHPFCSNARDEGTKEHFCCLELMRAIISRLNFSFLASAVGCKDEMSPSVNLLASLCSSEFIFPFWERKGCMAKVAGIGIGFNEAHWFIGIEILQRNVYQLLGAIV